MLTPDHWVDVLCQTSESVVPELSKEREEILPQYKLKTCNSFPNMAQVKQKQIQGKSVLKKSKVFC